MNLLKTLTNEEIPPSVITGFNMGVTWMAGKFANTVANSLFHFDLNKYNSVDHLIVGVGIGTHAYKKAGGGAKGVLTGLITASLCNLAWEYMENRYVFRDNPFKDKEAMIDTFSDVAMVYAGDVLSVLGDKFKNYINSRAKISREEKWVL